MKAICLCVAIFAVTLGSAASQAKNLNHDPLTGLPVSPATYGSFGNEPDKMPDGQVCKSKMRGDFYMLSNITMDAVTTWYASHLPGFKKAQGYESGRTQVAFYNSDGTNVIFLTGSQGAKGENTDAYSAAYERYEPGLSEKIITSLTQGQIVCN
ncbi:MAG: hypothetical protein LAP86_23815 [Acidobacteriia bacterium]|nr:hypothetical protein [Terriglobia bacterium]